MKLRVTIFFIFIMLVGSIVPRNGLAHELSAQPAQFFQTTSGDFYGFTTTGQYFTQRLVQVDEDIRLQHFALGSVDYYISDRGIIHADSTMQAMSIYLART